MSTLRKFLPPVDNFLSDHNLTQYSTEVAQELSGVEELLLMSRHDLNKFGMKVRTEVSRDRGCERVPALRISRGRVHAVRSPRWHAY